MKCDLLPSLLHSPPLPPTAYLYSFLHVFSVSLRSCWISFARSTFFGFASLVSPFSSTCSSVERSWLTIRTRLSRSSPLPPPQLSRSPPALSSSLTMPGKGAKPKAVKGRVVRPQAAKPPPKPQARPASAPPKMGRRPARASYDQQYGRALNLAVAQERDEQKAAKVMLTRTVLPMSGTPIRFPSNVRRSVVNSARWTFTGPDSRGLIGLVSKTSKFWQSVPGNWAMVVFFGQAGRPAMVSVDRSRYTGGYTVRFYDQGSQAAANPIDLGSDYWLLTDDCGRLTTPNEFYPRVLPIESTWSIASVTGQPGVYTQLHGFNMPVGSHEGTDVLFLQGGDNVTFTFSYSSTVSASGTPTGLTLTYTIGVYRVGPRTEVQMVDTVQHAFTGTGTISGFPSHGYTFTVPSDSVSPNVTWSDTNHGHYFFRVIQVEAKPATGTVFAGYAPAGQLRLQIGLTPSLSSSTVGWSLVANPLIDPSQRGDGELGRTCRVTAASVLISPGTNVNGGGLIECFRADWDDTLQYENLRSTAQPQSLPSMTGCYTYLPYQRSHLDWREATWGASPVYDVAPPHPAHIMTFISSSTATLGFGLTFEMALETVADTSRMYGSVATWPATSLDDLEKLIASRQEYFVENPEHLKKLWSFISDAGTALWRGARVLTPYIAPMIATVNPEAAIIVEAFNRMLSSP